MDVVQQRFIRSHTSCIGGKLKAYETFGRVKINRACGNVNVPLIIPSLVIQSDLTSFPGSTSSCSTRCPPDPRGACASAGAGHVSRDSCCLACLGWSRGHLSVGGHKRTPLVKHSSRLLSNSFTPDIETIHPFDCHVISTFAAFIFIKPDVCQINFGFLIFSLHLNLRFPKCAIPFFVPFISSLWDVMLSCVWISPRDAR